jgi:nitrous oxidase accessory protein NosD
MKIKFIIVLLLCSFLLLNFSAPALNAENNNEKDTKNSIIYVDNTNIGPAEGTYQNPYSKIQTAINNAEPGDTILISNGQYNENVTVNKSVNLKGETLADTVICGEPSVSSGHTLASKQRDFIIKVLVDDVKISTLTVLGFSEELNEYGYLENTKAAIIIKRCLNVTISNVLVTCANISINIIDSAEITIIRNKIALTQTAIKVINSSYVTISQNDITLSLYCLDAIDLINSIVTQNNFLFNLRAVVYKISFRNIKDRAVFSENYWLIPRILPKVIFVRILFGNMELPWIFLDKKPAFSKYSY